MEIFELREEIDELTDDTEMKHKLIELESNKYNIEQELLQCFTDSRYHDAAELVVRLQYMLKVC